MAALHGCPILQQKLCDARLARDLKRRGTPPRHSRIDIGPVLQQHTHRLLAPETIRVLLVDSGKQRRHASPVPGVDIRPSGEKVLERLDLPKTDTGRKYMQRRCSSQLVAMAPTVVDGVNIHAQFVHEQLYHV